MPQPCELVHRALLIQKISGPACESQLTVSKSHRSGVEVGGGASSKDIAEALGTSKRSIDGRMMSAARKIGAANRIKAVALALRRKLIE